MHAMSFVCFLLRCRRRETCVLKYPNSEPQDAKGSIHNLLPLSNQIPLLLTFQIKRIAPNIKVSEDHTLERKKNIKTNRHNTTNKYSIVDNSEKKKKMKQFFMFLVVALIGGAVNCFVPAPPTRPTNMLGTSTLFAETAASTDDAAIDDDDEIVGRRIIVKGDVNGGYYRSCVLNEAGRFRRLIGTMTPPDDSDTAEIYVEGKKKMVEGFIRWCKRGKVGLNQVTEVDEIFEEDPTGLYDDFYCKTH